MAMTFKHLFSVASAMPVVFSYCVLVVNILANFVNIINFYLTTMRTYLLNSFACVYTKNNIFNLIL